MTNRVRIAPQLRHAPPDRRRARRARRDTLREQQCRGAGGASRRRQDHAGAAGAARRALAERTRRSSCWSRGGSRRAPAPSAWRGRSASAPARPSAIASASARKYRARRGSRSSPRASSRGRSSTIPNSTGVAAVLFDEFHERSLDADLGPGAGARRADRLARGSAHPGDVGDARRRARRRNCWATRRWSRAKAAPFRSRRAISAARRMRRSSGRWRMRSRPRCAPIPARCWRSCRAPPKSAARRIFSLSGFTMRASRSCRCSARSMPPCRTAPSRRRRRASRKVVLATSIAETSLTIEGVRIVVDSGMARVPRYEPDIGLTRLETVRASRAAVDQRRGRAGRTEPGVCYRLWDEPQTASLAAYTQPEILSADLSSLVLDLAQWGVARSRHAGVSRSAAGAGAEGSATACSSELGALDADGRITAEGKSLRALALPPRLARMIVDLASRWARARGRRHRRHPDRARPRRRQRRSRSSGSTSSAATARRARPARAAWRSAGRSRWRRRRAPAGEDASPSTGIMLALCLSRSRRAQPRQWQFRARQRPRRRRRADLVAGARALYRGRRTDRHRRAGAHSAGGADRAGRYRDALCRSDREHGRDFVRSRRDGVARAPQADAARDHAVGSADGAVALGGDRAHLRRRAWSPPGSTSCRGRNP